MEVIIEEAYLKIGDKINSIIIEKGITARYLAVKTGISYRRIRLILKGEVEPSLEELRRLCIYLKIRSSKLLDF